MKTNAMRILDHLNISYQVHEYEHHGNEAPDGMSVAMMLNQNPDCVLKTLITRAKSTQIYVFVIPVNQELDLKKAAALVHEKSIEMVAVKEINAISGYIRSGCSPIGMKKCFPTYISQSAYKEQSIFFSAGQIGLQIEMNPQDLNKAVPVYFDL